MYMAWDVICDLCEAYNSVNSLEISAVNVDKWRTWDFSSELCDFYVFLKWDLDVREREIYIYIYMYIYIYAFTFRRWKLYKRQKAEQYRDIFLQYLCMFVCVQNADRGIFPNLGFGFGTCWNYVWGWKLEMESVTWVFAFGKRRVAALIQILLPVLWNCLVWQAVIKFISFAC